MKNTSNYNNEGCETMKNGSSSIKRRNEMYHHQPSSSSTLRTTSSSTSELSCYDNDTNYQSFSSIKQKNNRRKRCNENYDDVDESECLGIANEMKRLIFSLLFLKPCKKSCNDGTADTLTTGSSWRSFEWFDYDENEEEEDEYDRPDLNAATLWKEKRLGGGMYGQVHLVRMVEKKDHDKLRQEEVNKNCRTLKKTFALKIQDYTSHKRQREIDEEIDIMNRISSRSQCPFLCQLYNVYYVEPSCSDMVTLNGKNKSDLTLKCMVLDAYGGGELFSKIHSSGKQGLSESLARFYAANLWIALKSLHSLHIAYRDMKPENILLDSNGYCHLIDFGFAKFVGEGRRKRRCKTICGTPLYFAPEVLKGKGYDGLQADMWSYGVLVYEMLTGHTPFCREGNLKNMTRPALYRSIMSGKYKFPSHGVRREVSGDAKHFVSQLLQLVPHQRLGCSANTLLEEHPWFTNPCDMEHLHFEQLHQKKLIVPF